MYTSKDQRVRDEVRQPASHSNSFGNDAEKDTAGCRALYRKYIVIGGAATFLG